MKRQFLFNALLFLGIFFSVHYSFSQVKIGENIEQISPYAVLELESSEKGFLLPRMTTAERDAAFNQDTPAGMMIFNLDERKMQFLREETDASGRKTGFKVWEGPREGIDLLDSGENPPLDPVIGQLYFDRDNHTLYVWEGTQWVQVSTNNGSQTTVTQSLTLSQTILSISQGNSVDLASLGLQGAQGPQGPQGVQGPQGPQGPVGPTSTATGTAQMLTASALSAGSTMTLAISDGNTITLDLSALEDTDTNTDSQTLTVNGNAQITEGLYDSDRNHGVVGQYLSSIGPTGTKWSNPLSFINSTGNGTRSGNTLYWDNTVSKWVETDFLNHQFDLIPDGGKELEAQPTVVHEISGFLDEYGAAPSSDGNYLFVTVETSHNQFALQLVDISNPAQPVEVGSPMNFPGVPSNAEQYSYSVVNNNHLYIIGFQRILVYDVSTPTAPSLIQNLPATGGASFSAVIYENHLYVTRILADRIDIYDASTPGSLSFAHTINAPNNNDVFDLEIVDDILYVGVSDEELSIYNVSTPTAPVLLQTINLPFNRWRAIKLIAGQYLYAATHSELTVFNVVDPTNPVAIGSLNAGLGGVPGSFNPLENGMILLRNSLIVADQFDNILHYIDVSNPAVPKYKYTVSLGGTGERITSIVQTGTSTYTYAFEFGATRGLSTLGNEFTDGFQSSRVGIGTTSPDQTLSVNGNASKSGGGTWATFSDRRVKKNIRQYEKGLDEILQIKPVIFNYNDKSGYSNTHKDYVGVIAQDIEGVLPSTITRYDDSNGPSGLSDKRQFDSSEVLWALVNAVKELQAQNEALKARVKQLEK